MVSSRSKNVRSLQKVFPLTLVGEMRIKKFQRLEFIKNIIEKIEGNILDVGCSAGVLHSELIRIRAVYGLDILPATYPKFVKASATYLPFKSACFDVIVSGELIEHLRRPRLFIKECLRTLKMNGVLILTTPNRDSWWNRITKAYHIKEHVNLMNRGEICRMLRSYGFSIQEIRYVPYDANTSGLGLHHFYWFRKCVHNFLPNNLKENMIVVATLLKKVTGSRTFN